MTYCTQDNLVDRFGETEIIQLTDRTRAGAMDSTVVALAISDAAARIDAKLRTRYTLPFSTTPAELEPIACDITRFFLWGEGAPEIVKDRFTAAMRELTDYATGRNVLDVAIAEDTTTAQSVAVEAGTAIFTDELFGTMP
jgi:phage gp36-like protein